MKGPVYEKYIVPFMLGDTSFLSLFSSKDQEKFLMFLQGHHLLARRGGGGHQYHRVRSSGGRRSSTLDEKLNETVMNYLYTQGIFDFDPDEEEETEEEEDFLDEGEQPNPRQIYLDRKDTLEGIYHINRGEFDTVRNDMRIRGQEALHNHISRSVAQHLLNVAADATIDPHLHASIHNRFRSMGPRAVSRTLSARPVLRAVDL